jgi:hypothetical protein
MIDADELAELCSIYACDRARGQQIDLPRPGSPECDALFLASWAAFRHVTTEMGKQCMVAAGTPLRDCDALEAFVQGRAAFPAHVRWAEAEAMIRACEWTPS